MLKFLKNFDAQSYALLRIVSGFLFSFHGMQKVIGIFGSEPKEFGTQMWVGGAIELVAGLLIMAGLGTRIAAFLASGTMAVAYAQFHWKGAMDANFFPPINRGELAAIYSFLFLYIAAKGSGIWALKKD